MSAQRCDLLIEQGAEFSQEFVYQDSEGKAKDLTGYTGKAQVRVTYTSTEPMLEFTVTLGGKAGTIILTATAAETTAMVRAGVWDLKLTPGGGEPFRLLEGTAKFSPEATR